MSTARHSTLTVGCFGKLTWRIGENWREPSTHPSEIRARTNVDQVFGIMHQDGLPKRAMRTARRLFFVYYADPGVHRCRTRADRIFCKNWTAHRRNKFLKEFGDYLPLANPLAGSTPEDAEALAQILHGPGLSAKPEEIA